MKSGFRVVVLCLCQGMAAEGRAERRLLLQKWQAARVEVQKEWCARLKAQSALEGLNKALREEKASRLKAEAEVRLKVSQLQKVEKSHQSVADQAKHLQQQLHDCQVSTRTWGLPRLFAFALTQGREGFLPKSLPFLETRRFAQMAQSPLCS
jgi:hypothetical protein